MGGEMNFEALVLLVCLVCESVFGQEAPIYGQPVSNIVQPIVQQSPYIINNPVTPVQQTQCSCVVAGTCTGVIVQPGTGTIDIRIVNPGTSTTTCPAGYVLCCTNGSTSPITDTTCGLRKVPSTTSKPVGQASYGAYPWQAALFDINTDRYIGAGVIISANFILTAAHKVANLGNSYKIRLGALNLASTTENVIVTYPISTTIHPNYNAQNLHNDIAIIRLYTTISFANYPNINSACLPTSDAVAGTRCWTAGWGVNAFSGGQYQTPLKEVDLPIVAQATCETLLRATRLGTYFQLDRTSFICAGGESGKDACTGDGGGALVCQQSTGQFQVVGLTSWGVGCGQANVPAAYVHVYNYLTWIRQHMGTYTG